ncbi:ABC transporter ATP-binding protein [Hoyosella subflava]|uniref:Putative iron-siderophore ABC transporter ATP-binding protein n=1 Tax=Hoyosella subflava (strain DSM 45089 / JCM 17490 / NBRC 109087 / DQS3-9A1) TaxID=443218 RepID=F6EML0_HOYSD|nr:ABC transporter ATP-binding protein [Hoyosella subflava]AEF41568.1 Putative iron-siderophore ABC transporter ATP-binding protein [Hoyosella subflava DQS3-9A1]
MTPTNGITASQPRSRLHAESITLSYGDRIVIEDLNLAIPTGGITTIIGPNGCGKSTLLRALGRLLKPREGSVILDGKLITSMRTKEVARVLGMLPQAPIAPEGLTVADLVSRGRHPHQSWLRQWSGDDEQEVSAALELTGIADLADRPINELSGGQRQRVWISMALAQGTDILLLDEPTTYLDLSHAVDVLDLIDQLHDGMGRTVVMVLHDLNLAIRYSDHLVVMKNGKIITQGTPRNVITADLLEEAFGLRATVIDDPASDAPLVVPIGTRHVHSNLLPVTNITP